MLTLINYFKKLISAHQMLILREKGELPTSMIDKLLFCNLYQSAEEEYSPPK